MKKTNVFLLFLLGSLFLAPASVGLFAQETASGAANSSQSAYRKRMVSLMEGFKNAKTDDQRKALHDQMRQTREEYRAANPVKELSPAEVAARRQKMEDTLKKDPFRWEMYQLRQSMSAAKTPEERKNYDAKVQALLARHAAEAEAKMTPEQRAAAQARQAKNQQMQAELKPLEDRMHAAKTDEERKSVRAQMREIFKKYR